MPTIDPEWRANLKVGDNLDILKEEHAEIERVEGWAIGIIKEIHEDKLLCNFKGIPENNTAYYKKDGFKISPLGSRTGDWEWRNKLVINDIVDILDTQGKWFLGTVLDTKEIENNIKMVNLGFRVYLPNGSKIDDNGRRHEGWSSKYDTWLPTHSIRIQPYCLI